MFKEILSLPRNIRRINKSNLILVLKISLKKRKTKMMQDNSNQMPTLFSLNGGIYPEEKFTPTFPEHPESNLTVAAKADGKQKNRRNWSPEEERGFYEIWGRDNWKLTLPGKTKQTFTEWAEELHARYGMDIKFTEIQGKVNQSRMKFKQEVKHLAKGEDTRRWKKFDLLQQILSNQFRSPDAEPIPIEALEKNRDLATLDLIETPQGNNQIPTDETYNVIYATEEIKAQQQIDSQQYNEENRDVGIYNDPRNNNINNGVIFENNENNIIDKMKDNNKFIYNNVNDEHSDTSQQQHKYFVNLHQHNEINHILQEPQEFLTQRISQNNPTNSSPQAYIQNLADNNNIPINNHNNNNIINNSITNETQQTQSSLLKKSLDSPQMPFFSQSPQIQNVQNNVIRPTVNNSSVIRSTTNSSSEFQINYIDSFLTQNKDKLLNANSTITSENNTNNNIDNKFQFGVTATGEIDPATGLAIKKPVYVTLSQLTKFKNTKKQQLQQQEQFRLQGDAQQAHTRLPQKEEAPTSSSNTHQQKASKNHRIRRRWLPDVELEYLMEIRKRNMLLSDQKDLSLQSIKIEEKKVALMEEFFPKCVQMHEEVLKQFMSFNRWINDPNEIPAKKRKQDSKPKTEEAKTTEINSD